MPRHHQSLEDMLIHNSAFQDFFAAMTGGTSGHDHLNGTDTGNMLFSGRGDDDVAGKAANDMLDGGKGNDNIWGGSGNDNLSGGKGNGPLVVGFRARHMKG